MAQGGLTRAPGIFRLACALALAAILLLAGAVRAQAGDTQIELVPEVNAYLKLSDHARLFLPGSLTQGLSESATDGEVGVHLDLTLTPILRRRLRDADWERDRYLWVRIGYQLLGNLDDREDGFTEHRGILEPYYTRQEDQHSSTAHVDRLGLVLKTYW